MVVVRIEVTRIVKPISTRKTRMARAYDVDLFLEEARARDFLCSKSNSNFKDLERKRNRWSPSGGITVLDAPRFRCDSGRR